jgi:hypothetical protein
MHDVPRRKYQRAKQHVLGGRLNASVHAAHKKWAMNGPTQLPQTKWKTNPRSMRRACALVLLPVALLAAAHLVGPRFVQNV